MTTSNPPTDADLKADSIVNRIIERTALKRERPNELTKRTGEEGTGNHCANTVAGMSNRTLGWKASCKCNASTVPCRVLDPFGGAGTTGLVAQRLGRDAVLCELNEQYAEMARARIHDDAPLLADVRLEAA